MDLIQMTFHEKMTQLKIKLHVKFILPQSQQRKIEKMHGGQANGSSLFAIKRKILIKIYVIKMLKSKHQIPICIIVKILMI